MFKGTGKGEAVARLYSQGQIKGSETSYEGVAATFAVARPCGRSR